jgi:hypothetical protein
MVVVRSLRRLLQLPKSEAILPLSLRTLSDSSMASRSTMRVVPFVVVTLVVLATIASLVLGTRAAKAASKSSATPPAFDKSAAPLMPGSCISAIIPGIAARDVSGTPPVPVTLALSLLPNARPRMSARAAQQQQKRAANSPRRRCLRSLSSFSC